ncbi:hypothetical protein AHYW_002640 [Providencia manganoxydans]|uniref:hypothetical protein n=1 Tax=Providencia manganoxydans TaxID=2923283 RepID=UPI003DA1C45C
MNSNIMDSAINLRAWRMTSKTDDKSNDLGVLAQIVAISKPNTATGNKKDYSFLMKK